jgi:hypothetical protein
MREMDNELEASVRDRKSCIVTFVSGSFVDIGKWGCDAGISGAPLQIDGNTPGQYLVRPETFHDRATCGHFGL